ncbi:MAG TPA: 50S ribosomal protein L29 [Chitinophagaceae bacterium]|jgi:large subunit ribosomal protein L29|nr:50S ribosomal protein L29 [Bacteroidota bacterium]HAD34487.1 50S ribosomal protein L29 [Chitinophagaceae bacterium]
MAAKSKTSNTQDLNALSVEDIRNNIQDAELRLKKMTFSHAITPIDNPMGIRILRREIARLKTAQRRKQLGF